MNRLLLLKIVSVCVVVQWLSQHHLDELPEVHRVKVVPKKAQLLVV